MKKGFLISSLVIMLLVSCATKPTVDTELVPEVVDATVVDQLPEQFIDIQDLDVAQPVNEPVEVLVDEPADEPIIEPISEPADGNLVEESAVSEVSAVDSADLGASIDESEFPVESETVVSTELPQSSDDDSAIEPTVDNSEMDNQYDTEEGVMSEDVIPESEDSEVPEPSDDSILGDSISDESEDTFPVIDVDAPITAPVVEEPPSEATDASVPVVSTPSASSETLPDETSVVAEQPVEQEPEQELSFLQKLLNFAANEVLFTIGIAVFAIGFIYLIVAMIRTSKGATRRRLRKKEHVEVEFADASQTTEAEGKSSVDTEPTDEDSKFLEELLKGDD